MDFGLITIKRPLNIKISAIKNILLFIFFISVFLFSKTVAFGIINRSQFQWVFYACCFLSLFVSNISIKTFKENIINCAPFFILILVQFIQINRFSSDGFNVLAGQVMVFAACICFATSITKEQFYRFYLTTLTVICIISIPCYFISILNQELAKNLAITDFIWRDTIDIPYEYSYFYTWGTNGHFYLRNAGMFWEPGAFQGFIILGILIILNQISKQNYDFNKNIVKFQFILFFFTLLTTRSTTGYILCILLFCVFFNKISAFFSGNSKNKIIIYLITVILIGIAFVYIVVSNNISDKLTGEYTNSSEIRLNDLIQSINLVFSERGIFGYGPTIDKDLIETSLSLEQNSIGLLSMTYTYGIIFGIYYLIRLILGVKNFYNNLNKFEFFVTLLIIIILHMTEGLWNLPIYILLLMKFKEPY